MSRVGWRDLEEAAELLQPIRGRSWDLVGRVGERRLVDVTGSLPAGTGGGRARLRLVTRHVSGDAGGVPVDPVALPLPARSVHGLRAERVLEHAAEPEAVLREFARVTRRGGRIVAMEFDWSSYSLSSRMPYVARVLARTRVEDLLHGRYVGARDRLDRLARDAGLRHVAVTSHVLRTESLAAARVLGDLNRVEQAARVSRRLAASQVEAWRRDLELLADGTGRFTASVTVNLLLALTY